MGQQKKASTNPAVDRLLEDAQLRAASQPVQLQRWVQDAAGASREVARGNRDLVGSYWIGLYGTLHELKLQLDEHRKAVLHRLRQNTRGSGIERLSVLNSRLEAIGRIRRCFDEDDCVYIQFMRHVYAHPLLGGYAVSGKANKPDEQIAQRLIGKTLSVKDTNAAIDRVLLRRKELVLLGNALEHAVARDFASVSEQPQQELAAVWSRSERVWI